MAKTKPTGAVQRLALSAPGAAQAAFEAYCRAEQAAFEAYCRAEGLTGTHSYDADGYFRPHRTWADLNEHARAVWQLVADAVLATVTPAEEEQRA